jgi:catechol 2,3-dioxygenase
MSERPELAKLGHISMVTPDLEKSVWFWSDVIGLEEVERRNGDVYMRAWGEREHHSLRLSAGKEASIDHIGWRTKRPDDVKAFGDILEAQGIAIEWLEPGDEAGQGRACRFTSPAGHRYEIYYDVEKPLAPVDTRARLKNSLYRFGDRGVSPRRIDHVNVCTTDPDAGSDWLAKTLGFKTREMIKGKDGRVAAAWMAVTPTVHDIAIQADADGLPGRFHHVAYWVDDAAAVLRAADLMMDRGIEIFGPGRHGISQAMFLYTIEPGSGHRVEIYSGSYLILDPDWEPVVWHGSELDLGIFYWGAKTGASMELTTPF